MALRRKGSRRIVVDGVTYRWYLRTRPTYSQGLCWSPLTYAVELSGGAGKTLLVTTNQAHPGNWLHRPAPPVLPADVARTIREALEQGWTPDASGPQFHLDLSSGFAA
jgi:hypothetical protein